MSYVVGHRDVIERLRGVLTGERYPHALLFVGREGIGKKRVALLSAAMFLCSRGGCESCRVCKKVFSGVHPDVRLEYPKGKRSILIDQVRELKEWAFMTPMEGERKVAIIDDAHLMKTEAANALLKTLEEPPDGTLFILVTSEPSRLLPTIVSRCQIVRFTPLKREEVDEICEREGVEEEIKDLCQETGSLMFLSIDPQGVKLAKETVRRLLSSPSLRLMGEEQIWKDQKLFNLFLYLLRRELNRCLRTARDGDRYQRFHQRLLEVERLFYSSNVNPRSLFEYLILEAA